MSSNVDHAAWIIHSRVDGFCDASDDKAQIDHDVNCYEDAVIVRGLVSYTVPDAVVNIPEKRLKELIDIERKYNSSAKDINENDNN